MDIFAVVDCHAVDIQIGGAFASTAVAPFGGDRAPKTEPEGLGPSGSFLKRVKGIEPSTFTLAR